MDSGTARIRRVIDELRASRDAAARWIARPAPQRRLPAIAVVAGAFNPPTLAHLALARAARDQGFDPVVFSLGLVTLDKAETGIPLAERLALVAALAAREDRMGVVVQNRGLYADQAAAIRTLFTQIEDVAFVVGTDKVPQIFDRRYYDDFESSLASLFASARFLVAPRGGADHSALANLLARPPADRFADRFRWLDLDRRWRDVSATTVCARLARGEDVSSWVPSEVMEFLHRTPTFRR